MRSNNGLGAYEILTMIVILLFIGAFLMYYTLGVAYNQKIKIMKSNAVKFSDIVNANIDSFHNTGTIYLSEVIDGGFLKKIKSPFSSGNCDVSESKVEFIDALPYVTLKCDNYLVERVKPDNSYEVKVYEVGEWSTKKPSSDFEEKLLYNCFVSGKEMFDDYGEELYMISRINKQKGTDYYLSDGIADICEVKTNTFYRTKRLVN